MLILSQDKNGIVNLTNITSILVENKELIARVTNGHKATLGEYDTKERAKEVLQEIFKVYRLNKMLECSDRIEQVETLKAILKENMKPFIYEIPKE